MRIELTAVAPRREPGWVLEIGPQLAELRAPTGVTVDTIPLSQAALRLQLPRVGGHQLSVIIGDRVLKLAACRKDVRALRGLVKMNLPPAAPHTLRSLRLRAVRHLTIGLATATTAGCLATASWLDATGLTRLVADPERLQLVIGYALLLLLGLLAVGLGVHGISRYAELKHARRHHPA